MTEKEREEELSQHFSDYDDGTLSTSDRQKFELRLENDKSFQNAYRVFQNTQAALASMGKTPAPTDFGDRIAETIHKRSGGRFFGRRAFGDRIPFELLTVFILALTFLLTMLLRKSDIGTFDFDRESSKEWGDSALKDVIPRP